MERGGKIYYIYLFRHGRTVYNVKGLFTGWKDSKLSKEGVKDAKKIASRLKNKKFEVAIHTRLSRSKNTLKYVLKYHPECKKLIKDDRIIERSYGVLEGTSHEDFIKKVGKQEYNLKVQGDAIENFSPIMKKKVEKFLGEKEYEAIHRGYTVKAPGGESFADVEKRVKSFISYLKKFIRKNRVSVAISGHGNSIRLFRKIMENSSRDDVVKWFIPYDKVYVYKVRV